MDDGLERREDHPFGRLRDSIDGDGPLILWAICFLALGSLLLALTLTSSSGVFDMVSVAAPYTAAGAIIWFGIRRRIQYRRRANDPMAWGFGYGLDPEVVQRLLEKRRHSQLS
jgi:hypothetical protein